MKKINAKVIVIIMILLFFFIGCMRVEKVITVKKDGSGTIEVTDLMSKAIIEQFGEMVGQKLGEYSEESLKKDAPNYGDGVEYVSRKEVSDKKFQGVIALYSFKDVTKLSIEPFFEGETSAGPGGDGEKKADLLKFELEKSKGKSKLVITIPEEKEDSSGSSGEKKPPSDEDTEMMKSLMTDMYLSVKIKVDGKIKKTNAKYVDGSEVTLSQIDFNKLLDDEELFKKFNQEEENKEKQMEILNSIDGIMMEDQDKITIEFE